jgi:DNA-binding SARP family transcriptional activator
MIGIEFVMLGRFSATRDGVALSLGASKARELLCYILLFRGRPHQRDVLADVLWGNGSGTQTKKYLRQALWQLRRTETAGRSEAEPLLAVDDEWVELNHRADVRLDVAELERGFMAVHGVPGDELAGPQVAALCAAVEVYRADLLEGWYQEWSLSERLRLKSIYLSMLEKLLVSYEHKGDYERGLLYGQRLLRGDPAHERTHLRMMRMQYLSGDRTAALRQFNLCAAALRDELSVVPSARTLALHRDICADRVMAEQSI